MRFLTPYAQDLRASSTDAERLLWSRLRAHRLCGLKFKRQQLIGRIIVYFVYFVCFGATLIAEVDGEQHSGTAVKDSARDAARAAQDFRVLRFWNNEVPGNIDGVVQRTSDSLPPSPRPSPVKEEGGQPPRREIAS